MKIAPLNLDTIGSALPTKTPAVAETQDNDGFGPALQAALGELEATSAEADAKAEGMVAGEVGLHEAMVAMEKADIALRVGTTVRNKLLDAYRTLSQTG